MRKVIILLLIFILIGILWIGSNFWTFSKDQYIDNSVLQKSRTEMLKIDLEYVKNEFKPADEF